MTQDKPLTAVNETNDLSEVESLRQLVQQQQATIAALEEQNQRLSTRIRPAPTPSRRGQ